MGNVEIYRLVVSNLRFVWFWAKSMFRVHNLIIFVVVWQHAYFVTVLFIVVWSPTCRPTVLFTVVWSKCPAQSSRLHGPFWKSLKCYFWLTTKAKIRHIFGPMRSHDLSTRAIVLTHQALSSARYTVSLRAHSAEIVGKYLGLWEAFW